METVTKLSSSRYEDIQSKSSGVVILVLIALNVIVAGPVAMVGYFSNQEARHNTHLLEKEYIKDISVYCEHLSLGPDDDDETFNIMKSDFTVSVSKDGRYICTYRSKDILKVVKKVVERTSMLSTARGLEGRPYFSCGNSSLAPESGHLTFTFSGLSRHQVYKEIGNALKLHWDKHPELSYVAPDMHYHNGEITVPEGRTYFVYASVHVNIFQADDNDKIDRPRRVTLRICRKNYGYEQTLLGTTKLFNVTNGYVASSLNVGRYLQMSRNDAIYVKVSRVVRHLLVAAIDFGTTFSTWGFSFKHEYDLEPTKVTAKQWTGLESAISLKGPTTILIKPDGKTIDSFGFDAETRYAELADGQQHKEWYYFKRFKMQLYDKIGLKRNFTIDDASGKALQAKTVFSLSIKYLKDDLLDMSKRQVLDQHLRETDIHWVLTVPAIWNDVAKQFMREAAEDAGIMTEKVTIALEPECASLYCQHIPTTRTQNSVEQLSVGSKYLILDAGGGTVDITAHEIMSNGILKEIYKATGGDWGGTKVDQAFEKFLCEITGDGLMEMLKDNAMEDYIDLMRMFEIKKREVRINSNRQISIKIPAALNDQTEVITKGCVGSKIQLSTNRDKVQLSGDKLRLDSSIMVGLFEESVKSILDHMDSLFALPQLHDCQTILMVGGYSESSVLQERIKTHFQNRMVIVPADAGLAVLKGAVMFGHNPSLIAERICRYTYGNGAYHTKEKSCTHRKTKTIFAEGEELCDDIFYVHVRAGDAVKVGERQEEQTFNPTNRHQQSILFDIYCTKECYPELVTDKGCVKLGDVEIPIPAGCDREVGVGFLFGGTELEVRVRDKESGTERKVSLSFLG